MHTLTPNCYLRLLLIILGVSLSQSLVSQEEQTTTKDSPPAFKTNRAEEDYSYLKDTEKSPYESAFGDGVKYIALNQERSTYLTLGGGYRSRVEHFTNKDWTTFDQTYYSQRLSLHAGLNIGTYVRVFGELYHGYTSDTMQLFQSDDLDFHQAFIEFKYTFQEKHKLLLILGRQELAFGATRLVGIRDGTNIRRAFDLGKFIYQQGKAKIELFYGKEVSPQFEAFDNEMNLFDSDATNPELWGVYVTMPVEKIFLTNEIYYFGFRTKASAYSDVFGEETRHTIGLRRFGNVGNQVTYNTEIIYQFGKLGTNTISAFNIETDWKYIFTNTKWRPTLGLKLDFSSGDRDLADDRLQTFNPMFVNPAVYSLAAVNTPANLTSFHPNITIFPLKDLSIFIDYALFYRTSDSDGYYAPPRFQARPAGGNSEKHIGDALGLIIQYKVNRHISCTLMSSYFIPAEFIEATGEAENTFFIAPTINFLF